VGSSERFLERSGRDRFERELEDVTMGSESFESPGEVSLGWDTLGAASRDDAEQNGRTQAR
jgi:hypothetical protein